MANIYIQNIPKVSLTRLRATNLQNTRQLRREKEEIKKRKQKEHHK
jgi:hypothetical protein